MSGDEEVTPRRGRGRPPKTPVEKTTPAPRSRSAKTAAVTPASGRKKRGEKEPEPVDDAPEKNEVPSSSRGRTTRQKEEKKTTVKQPAAVVPSSDSDNDVQIYKTVKPKPRSKSATAAPDPVVKKEEIEEEEQDEIEAMPAPDLPTSSKTLTRREKQIQAEAVTKPTRGGRAAAIVESEEEEEEEEKGKRTASRTTKRGKKNMEEDEEEIVEKVKGKKPAPPKSTRKGRKETVEEDEEEEEEEEEQTKRPAPTRSTRKGRKPVDEEEEEEEEEEAPVVKPTNWAVKGKKVVDVEEEAEKRRKAAKLAASRRKGRKAADSDEEEEEETDKKKGGPPTRRGKKTVVDEDEEEDDEEEEEPVRNTRLRKGGVRGKKTVVLTDESEEEEEEEEETALSKKGKGKRDKEQGTSHSKARRRINLDGENEDDSMEVDEVLQPLESPQKTEAELKAERIAARKERKAKLPRDDEDDVKPLLPLKPPFLQDISLELERDRLTRLEKEKSQKKTKTKKKTVEEEENEEVESVDPLYRDDDEITITGSMGIPAASHVSNKKTKESCIAAIIVIRNACRSVFFSKDERSMKNAVASIRKTSEQIHERPNEDFDFVMRQYVDEMEHQMINMMTKEEKIKETKAEIEGKQRVLMVIAKTLMKEFEFLSEDQYDTYWGMVHYFFNKFATAANSHIRAQFCLFVSYLLKYSKECFFEELEHRTEAETADPEDRRLEDQHMVKLEGRRRMYNALYQSLKHEETEVRVAAVKALAVIQDELIPPNFEEAINHSPKDLIMRQLMDVHVNVRIMAMEVLRPTNDAQIEFLLNAAMHEKHDNARKVAFRQLGRVNIDKFNKRQLHTILSMMNDNMLGSTIEGMVLHPWLTELVTGENPNPIGDQPRRRKKDKESDIKDKWPAAPLLLLRYLNCAEHSDDILRILKRASSISLKESGQEMHTVEGWLILVIDACEKENWSMITMTEYKHLLDRELDDATRATIVTFWLHCLQFSNMAKNEGERFDALNQVAPSMPDLCKLIIDLLDDEKERLEPRKSMREKGNIDVNHPAFIVTSSALQSVLAMLLSGFEYLPHREDSDSMKAWRELLFNLATGEFCDVSPAMWKVMMHDLLVYHTPEAERDDLIYELGCKMGFVFEDDRSAKSSPSKSPKRKSKSTGKESPSPSKKGGLERKLEDRQLVMSRPDCLGMITGALKTYDKRSKKAFFNAEVHSPAITAVFKAELDVFRETTDNKLQAECLECIGMFGVYSAEVAQRYIGLVVEHLFKPPPQDDDLMDEGMDDDTIRMRKRRKKTDQLIQDELEIEYRRREKEEKEKRRAEMRNKKGGANYCRGLSLAVLSDLIVAHSLVNVEEWMQSCEPQRTRYDVFTQMEKMAFEKDIDVVFMVAHAACKLSLHNREFLRGLNKTVALLQFRAMHPSSFSHPHYRACMLGFFPVFGSISYENQTILGDVVIQMLQLVTAKGYEYRHIIDKGTNASHAICLVSAAFAPSALKSNIRMPAYTAHTTLLKKLGDFCDKFEKDARENRKGIDMEYYKAILNAILGLEFVASSALSLRGLYNVVHNNIDLLSRLDGAKEAEKIARKVLVRVEDGLDQLNEIIRLNKAMGITLTDDKVRLPFASDLENLLSGLRKKVEEMGRDVRDASPVKDGREPRAEGSWTPANGTAKKRGRAEMSRGVTSTLKKEPAKSKSLAATATAERKEATAAAAAKETPVRPSTRAHLSRKRPMATIEEANSAESIELDSD